MTTVIIESNRQLAYKATKDSNNIVDANELYIQDSEKVNRWRTHLGDGQEVNVGDQISVEACMVNSIGGGDEVMEFLGRTGETLQGKGIKDNKIKFNFNFYISNNYEFAFPLPKSGCLVDTDFYNFTLGSPLLTDIGFPGVQFDTLQYAIWNTNYPMDGIEGFNHNSVAPPNRGFAEIISPTNRPYPHFYPPGAPNTATINNFFSGSIVKGNYASRILGPNNNRLYIGESEWDGPYYIPDITIQEEKNDEWKPVIASSTVEVPTGFSTPTSIAERITSQIHQRFGNADNWDVRSGSNLRVTPSQFSIDSSLTAGVIKQLTMPGITDSTYQIFPTTSGDGFYRRLGSNGVEGLITGWDSKYLGERTQNLEPKPVSPRGDKYVLKQGRRIFWSNLLCGNMREWQGVSFFTAQLQQRAFVSDNFNPLDRNHLLYSGPTTIAQAIRREDGGIIRIGNLGSFCCLLNNEKKSINKTFFNVSNSFDTTFDDVPSVIETSRRIICEVPTWELQNYDIVAVNILFTPLSVSIIRTTYLKNNFVNKKGSSTFNPLDKTFLESNLNFWMLGRLDDENSNPQANRQIYLPTPFMYFNGDFLSAPPRTPTQYFTDNVAAQGELNDSNLTYTIDMTTPKHNNRQTLENVPRYIGADSNFNARQQVRAFTYIDNDFYNADLAQANNVTGATNLYPLNPNSLFQTAIPNGDIRTLRELYDLIKAEPGNIKNQGVGIIPIFYRPGLGYDHLLNIPFVGIIVTNLDQKYPYPLIGEYFGPGSTSMVQNNLAKIVTTQKTDVTTYPQWTGTAGDSKGIQPQDYMPYIYAGANDALVDFGDQGRFTISQFHTPLTEGNGPFQNIQPVRSQTPLLPILRCLGRQSALSFESNNNVNASYNLQLQQPSGLPFVSAQSGIGIDSIEGFFDLVEPKLGSFFFDSNRGNLYNGTLLDKCGFLFEQIVPTYGKQNSEFNRGNYNKYLGDNQEPYLKELNMVKPFTTNAYISSAEILALTKCIAVDVGTGTGTDIIPGPRPSGNLGTIINISSQTQASSDLLIGARMPQKLDYPYLVVYSDIVRNPIYYGAEGSQKLPAVAYLTRNYAEGDFFYSFATTWTHICDQNYILTDITTDIRLPDGREAPIDRNSSVIYKITKPPILPLPIDPKTNKQIVEKK